MKKLTIVLALTGLFLLIRLPVLSDPMVYEEGIFADITVHQTPGPYYLIYARFDGNSLYGSAEHPALMYELLRTVGSALKPWLTPDLSSEVLTFRLRCLFSLYTLPIWIALALVMYGSAAGHWALMLIAAAMSSPVAVMTSTQLQIDGSVGVLMTGPVVVALLAASRGSLPDRYRSPSLFGGAMVLGLGKQEWSMALLGAIVLWAAIQAWTWHRSRAGAPLWDGRLTALVAGLALGNLISFSIDSLNYMGGFRMMLRVGSAATLATGGGPACWLKVTAQRLPMLMTLFLLGAGMVFSRDRLCFEGETGSLLLRKGRLPDLPVPCGASPCVYANLLAFFALFLFLGFFISSWGCDPRYFAPALAAATAAVLARIDNPESRRSRFALVIITFVMIVHLGVFLGWRATYPCIQSSPPIHEGFKDGKCVPILSTAQAWNLPEVDFISNALTIGDSIWLAGEKHRTLCEQPGGQKNENCGWGHRLALP